MDEETLGAERTEGPSIRKNLSLKEKPYRKDHREGENRPQPFKKDISRSVKYKTFGKPDTELMS